MVIDQRSLHNSATEPRVEEQAPALRHTFAASDYGSSCCPIEGRKVFDLKIAKDFDDQLRGAIWQHKIDLDTKIHLIGSYTELNSILALPLLSRNRTRTSESRSLATLPLPLMSLMLQTDPRRQHMFCTRVSPI